MIVDIRDRKDWKKNGIEGSICIPIRHIPDNLEMFKQQDKVIFVCKSGLHSRRIAHKYRDMFDCEGDNINAVRNR
jgi:rhodanese-related sulfurtransferase